MNPTMTEAPVSKEALTETLQAFNLSEGEYQKIVSHLRREPNFTELGMFSALWSEHCCYKHTRHLLKKLPVTGPQIVQGPGENAGIVDCGDGIHVAFKVESHNHPTAVEPYQGAATGVGGILRDIITMNARPVALLNALRFGPIRPEESPAATRNHYLFTGAIKGIGDYGNCVGIPTIAGDVFFHENYSQNPLVNAMAIGIMEPEGMMSAQAAGIGNPVIYAGSPTGRDGMGGASFASKALDESQRAEDRPAVQVGDPFLEKLVLEACLEAFKTGAIVAAQDMGAAGLTCSCAEMADKGGVGMTLDLDKVPARERGMQAFEYLLSESQERMMMVVEKGRESEIFAIFDKWKIPAVVVGEVIAQPRFQVYHQGRQVVDLPVDLLTRLAPAYGSSDRPEEPEFLRFRRTKDAAAGLPDLTLPGIPAQLETLLGSLNIVERHGVFVQYDRHVRNNTLLSSENDCAGVIRLRKPDGSHSGRALAATLDGQPRFVALEPYMGSLGIVAEAARNLACVGARPLAVTDNLNFGDPDVEEVAYQLYYTVEGIKEACIALDTPVTGGNVSLYNTTEEGAIIPSPVIGMVGLLTDDQEIMTPWFKRELKQAGDTVALLGRFQPSLGGSEYQAIHGQPMVGAPPSVSLKAERFLVDAMVESLIPKKRLKSAQDVSTGGLLTTLVECLFCQGEEAPTLGLKLDLDALQASLTKPLRLDALLFGETHGSYVISYEPGGEKAIEKTLASDKKPADVAFIPLGAVLDRPVVELTLAGETVEIPLQPLFSRWKQGLGI